MVRYGVVALLALVPAAAGTARAGGKAEKDFRAAGKLTKDDPKDRKRDAVCHVHTVRMKKGGVYTIDMVSTQFDSYLRLEDAKGRELAEDDDSGGNLNAQIVFNCPKDGNYKVIATAYSAQGFGDYTLTVKRSGAAAVVATSHALLLGKAAADFAADFAVNGKAGRLSDLKGKVVLLQFWDVRSEPCAATFPRLTAWQKAHKDDGLEVVGVTFYHVDLGQRIGFDATTGKLTRPDEATRASEQAMLRDFAAYHKLGHVLLPLAKDDALKAFDAYAVNSMPQFVLIDRKGMVRAVHVGEGEATAAAVEAEIKKALAEK